MGMARTVGSAAGGGGGLAAEIGKRGGFESEAQEAYLNLVRTHAVLSAGFARLFRAHGLSEPQYNVLRIVAGAGRNGRTMDGIGCDMVARDPDVTRLVDRLEGGGYVERRRSEEDRRVVRVHATASGRGLLRRLSGPVLELHERQMGHMGARDLGRLSALLGEARRGEVE